MEILMNNILAMYEFLLFYPKSTTTLMIFLLIVIIIAFFVNRKRDASGRVSFVDKTKNGVTGVRLYETEEGKRKRNWLLPLWMPENNLLLNVRILLAKGDYDIRAYWSPDPGQIKESMFEPIPVEKAKVRSLSDLGRFGLAEDTLLEFKITASDKSMQIDSPERAALANQEGKTPLPLTLSDPSFEKFASKFGKIKQSRYWELPVSDPRIIGVIENELKGANRKADDLALKNKELKDNLDQVLIRVKKSSDPKGSNTITRKKV